ncbi:leucine-rich repeat-containing protein 15-like [Gigantopelta aegis]|uniref:leucine-rich repeat-containing protein 15-like n=1 Tax=Gigantopelta aegis TaxID=1735272 RepID=UPI001B88B7DA|nr:leucine-rich repeat-containing protein 15-like [Gigantopelta aegis]
MEYRSRGALIESLIGNEIEWIPPDLFKGTNIKILALSRNNIQQFPGDPLGNMPNLWFLGLNDNEIKVISKSHLNYLASSPLTHLNISHNKINYIQPGALSQLKQLKILELHNNEFDEIPQGTFNQIGSLLHIDLHKNKLESLTANSFTYLPKIITLRLHSQTPKMTNVQYNAFHNISHVLENLWISDNALKTFPHPALSEETWTALKNIYAEDNLITNPALYGIEHFSKSMGYTAKTRAQAHMPFDTLKTVERLYVVKP